MGDHTGTPRLEGLIHLIRGKRVMLDSDLARLYEVPTKALNQAVRRNHERFPDDFAFILTEREAASMRSQSVTASRRNIGRRPHAFTEMGVAMLSSVLRSRRAVAANIMIMRAFVRLREMASMHPEIADKFRQLEDKVGRHDREIGEILAAIRSMLDRDAKPKKGIGFRPD